MAQAAQPEPETAPAVQPEPTLTLDQRLARANVGAPALGVDKPHASDVILRIAHPFNHEVGVRDDDENLVIIGQAGLRVGKDDADFYCTQAARLGVALTRERV